MGKLFFWIVAVALLTLSIACAVNNFQTGSNFLGAFNIVGALVCVPWVLGGVNNNA